MKKICLILQCCITINCYPQSQEARQLLLDWEKLTQFKKILQDMYDGYKVVHAGYIAIRDISSGNFKMHKNFLDGLLEVSPSVKKYERIAAIINYQLQIVKWYKGAFNQFKADKNFTADEIIYIGKVYVNLFDESINNLEELAMVITSGELRMSDDERMGAIDKIYFSIQDQFSFLQDFNSSALYLSAQRQSEQSQINMSRKLFGY